MPAGCGGRGWGAGGVERMWAVTVDELLEVLAREGEALVAAARRAGPGAPVPPCPGWRVRDLVRHVGNIHRWATGFVASGRGTFVPPPDERVADAELVGWFRAGHARLLAALSAAPADLACWSFLPGAVSPRHFWARRQAHETTVHRVDAEAAAGGGGAPVAAGVAVDGVDELLTGFHARERSRVRSPGREVTLGVRVTDGPGVCWRVVISDGPPRARRVSEVGEGSVDCVVSGPAEAVYLALWNRRGWRDGVSVVGDASVAELWRRTSAV